MARRSPARFLAPLALATCAVVAYLIVHDGKRPTAEAPPRPAATAPHRAPAPTHRTYTVKPGDVLSAIAQREGLTVERLQALNPGLDAEVLRPGQKIKLR